LLVSINQSYGTNTTADIINEEGLDFQEIVIPEKGAIAKEAVAN